MKPSETLRLVAHCEASYGTVVSDESRQLWCELLADVDARDATTAFDEQAATSNFPPTPQRVRLRALELGAGLAPFGDVFAELVAAASTCDYFDPNPPASLSAPALALARVLSWADFRVSDPGDTYYVHQAQLRYEEITERARRRLFDGLPAFETLHALPDVSNGFGALVDGIGGQDA